MSSQSLHGFVGHRQAPTRVASGRWSSHAVEYDTAVQKDRATGICDNVGNPRMLCAAGRSLCSPRFHVQKLLEEATLVYRNRK